MITKKEELKIGKIIVNEKAHFRQETKIVDIDDQYVYCELHQQKTVMPISFYLNKHQFSLLGSE